MQRLGILMLGGAKRVSVGRMLIEAGRRLGYDVTLYSYELDCKVPIAEIAEIVIGKKWKDADILEHINEIIEIKGIDIVIPFVDGAIEVAAKCRQGRGAVFAPVGSADIVTRMFNKIEADSLFRRNSLPVPELRHPSEGRFPIIAKPALGSASKGIVMLHNNSDIDKLDVETDYIYQEFIDDKEEFTVDCYVASNGRVIAAVPRRRVETAGGEVTRTVTEADHEVIRLADMVLGCMGLSGAVTLQFIRDKVTGRTMLMEINPRLGGGVVCSVHAGANIPGMIISEWAGNELIPARWTPGIEIARYFQEVVFKNN